MLFTVSTIINTISNMSPKMLYAVGLFIASMTSMAINTSSHEQTNAAYPFLERMRPLSLLEGDGVSLMLQFIAFFISILHNQFNCLCSKGTNKFSNCKINANYLANINDFYAHQSIYRRMFTEKQWI